MSKSVHATFGEDKAVKVLYHVTFTWCDDYRPKTAGVKSVVLVVEGEDKFNALANAWNIAKALDETEPKDMTVKRIEVCE